MFRAAWLKSVRSAMTGHTSERARRVPSRRKATPLAVDISLLETRTLLSAVGPLAPVTTEQISDGAVIIRTQMDASEARVIAPGESSVRVGELNGNGLQFNLIPAVGMTQQSIDGFQDAADLWSVILRDDVMINIDINFTALDPGVLAQAGSTTQGNSLSSVKTALAGDAKSLTDATAVANLPSGTSLSIYTSDVTTSAPELDNNGTGNNNTLDVNTTVAKAIGLRTADNATVDAEITFSSLFTWDFDRSDGIAAGAFDFVGVVAHEIGHALGFVSGADTVDFTTGNGPAPQEIDNFRVASVLDLFRVSAASLTAGADIDLRADTTTKSFSIDGGTTLLTTFSTGSFNGDGRQASHWKDNLNIGIMDPTAATAEYTDITAFDVQAFDAMGWDVAMDLGDAPDASAGTANGNYSTNLSDNGPRHLLFAASGNINDPAGAPKVFLGASVTSELAALQNATATGDADNGISSIPTLNPGATQNFTVSSSGNNAVLNYFFDFNRDGDFSDAGEAFNTTLTSGSQSVSVTVPAGASVGTSFARFRISTAGGLSSVGAALDGEVEDYQVTISSGGGNTAPSIGGAASNQSTSDFSSINPFSTLTVTDPDTQALSATVRINNGTVRGDFNNATGWTRSVSGNNIQYSRTFPSAAGNAAIVQAAIRLLTFVPRVNAIKPNTTESTTFNVTVSDGIAAPVTNTATSVNVLSVNNAPTIGGANPNVAVNDNATVSPFAALTVSDLDTQEMLITVTILNGVNRGDFTNANAGTGWATRQVLGNNITYKRYFSPQTNVGSAAQAAFRALVFQPRQNAINPGTTELTDFQVTVSDGVAPAVANTATRVTTTSVNNAPVVGSTVANQTMNDNQTKAVFSTVTVTDPDNQAIFARVTIPNAANRGDFTAGSTVGWTRIVVGVDIKYERFFAAAANNGANVQTAIRALIFQPRNNVPISTSETTFFGIFVNDGPANTTNNGTSVITTGVAPRPAATILDQDVAKVVVPAVKPATSLLSRLLKKSR